MTKYKLNVVDDNNLKSGDVVLVKNLEYYELKAGVYKVIGVSDGLYKFVGINVDVYESVFVENINRLLGSCVLRVSELTLNVVVQN
ncbi:gp3 [Listeria phage A511]|uniref:Gp3 n=1 Tax=Listeria phage A511 TaxID=2908169 RepID=A8AT27_BPA51|nr:gp3 [Listeria phage A511]AAY52974.1 gp3 [Listeria phage A511]ACF22887.1 gp3 [Listeria phage A511]